LFKAHRLSLQQGKTKILRAKQFIAEEMLDPEEQETEAKRERLSELIQDLDDCGYSDVDEEDIDTVKIDYDTLRSLLKSSLGGEVLSMGLAKYALRKAAQLNSAILITDVIKNLTRLVPVYRDVIRYLLKTAERKHERAVGHALQDLLKNERVGFLPYIQLWTIDAFCKRPTLCPSGRALGFAEASDESVRDRLCALVAHAYNMPDWVRERKETWGNYGPWAQRAVLWASSVLPVNERRHWLKSAAGSSALLTRAVARVVSAK